LVAQRAGSCAGMMAGDASFGLSLQSYAPECRERVMQDVNNVVRLFPSLSAHTGVFVLTLDSNDELLVALTGSLPLPCQGGVVQVPVQVCLPARYPAVGPYCYVRPQPGTSIRPQHPVVQADGLCTFRQFVWGPNRTLVELLQCMVSVLASDPPIESVQPPCGVPGAPCAAPDGSAMLGSDEARLRTLHVRQALQARADALYEQYMGLTNGEVNHLLEQEGKLRSNAAQMEQRESYLRQDIEKLENCIQILRSKNEGLEKWLQEETAKAPFDDVDNLVVARDAVCQQQLDVVAEDEAIEDCLFALTRSLQRGQIEFEEYMKHVRSLSRKQCLARALSNRVLQVQANGH